MSQQCHKRGVCRAGKCALASDPSICPASVTGGDPTGFLQAQERVLASNLSTVGITRVATAETINICKQHMPILMPNVRVRKTRKPCPTKQDMTAVSQKDVQAWATALASEPGTRQAEVTVVIRRGAGLGNSSCVSSKHMPSRCGDGSAKESRMQC